MADLLKKSSFGLFKLSETESDGSVLGSCDLGTSRESNYSGLYMNLKFSFGIE